MPEVEQFNVTGGSILSGALLGNAKPIEIVITGSDLDILSKYAKIIEDSLKKFLISLIFKIA